MKKTITLVACLLFISLACAQQVETEKKSLVLDGIVKLEQVEEREPTPYPAIQEADVFWSKRVWRTIDLKEKLNYPLYYPTEVLRSRKSFVQALVGAIKDGKIKAYDTDSDEFITELSADELNSRFEATSRTETRAKMDGSGDTTITITGQFNWGEVQELLVKEDWYFDKRLSQMFIRIIGICPIRVYAKEINTGDEGGEEEAEELETMKKQLFWIYYPDARKVLANTLCFVGDNEMAQISFDDLFQNRRFASYITAVSNNQNNRKVETYTRTGLEAMLESERLRNELMNFESDLWEY